MQADPARTGVSPLDRLADILEGGVSWLEGVVAAILAIVIVFAVVEICITLVNAVAVLHAGPGAMQSVVTAVLDTFIVVELFRITVAYIRRTDVIFTVLETALVVAAREIVVIKAGTSEPIAGMAVAGTLLAIALAWFLLRRSASEPHDRAAAGNAPATCEADTSEERV